MKDYKNWHIIKSHLHERNYLEWEKPMFRERDIWWCSIGENIGYEQDGKHENFERPVLILKKFNQDMFLWVPLTSSESPHPLRYLYSINDKPGSINLTQTRTMSVKRLHRRMGKMSEDHFKEIQALFSSLFSIKSESPDESGQSRTPDGEK